MPSPQFTAQHAYDPLLRLIHAWNALAILGLVVTSQIPKPSNTGRGSPSSGVSTSSWATS